MDTAKRFEEFSNALDNANVIRIGRSVSELKGIGTEYLVVDGTVIAKFYNGGIVGVALPGNNEVTAVGV